MRNYLFLITIVSFLFGSCLEKKPYSFQEIPCDTVGVDYTTNPNVKKIYKPCRQFIYVAKLWDLEYNQISKEYIRILATGRAWSAQPDLQDEIIIEFSLAENLRDSVSKYIYNNQGHGWTKSSNTGIIETAERIWLHPIRSNQYNFTEVAAFPEVRFPLAVGQKWNGGLNIGEGWGQWANSSLSSSYEVLGIDSVNIPYGEFEAWKITSYTAADFGDSTHNFWFHEELGFVKMIVRNYWGQIFSFELVEVKDV